MNEFNAFGDVYYNTYEARYVLFSPANINNAREFHQKVRGY